MLTQQMIEEIRQNEDRYYKHCMGITLEELRLNILVMNLAKDHHENWWGYHRRWRLARGAWDARYKERLNNK